MGRTPLLLNEDIRKTILKLIGKGNYIKTACMAAGIDEKTLWNWQKRAENYNPASDNGSEDKIYFQFFLELKKARQENIAGRVAKIEEAGKKPQFWAANAWLLERMEPGDYGKRLELEVGPSKVLLALQERANKALPAGTEGDIIEGEAREV